MRGLGTVDILALEDVHEKDEHRQHQRSENNAHEPEKRQSDQHAENRYERMRIGHLLLQNKTDHIVRLRNYQHPVDHQTDSSAPIALHGEIGRERNPHERRSDDGKDGGKTRYHAPENRTGDTADKVSHIRDRPLNHGDQRDADRIRTHDHIDFAHHIACDDRTERKQRTAIILHAAAADQHEIEHEQQHDDIDSEAEDALQERLPHSGNHGDHRRDIGLLQQVVSRPLVNQGRDMTDGIDQRLRIECKILHLVYEHPHDPAQGNQEADDSFDEQQRGGQAPSPPMANRQITHLIAQQHVDRHSTEQPPDIRRQLGKDGHAQHQNDNEKRITPILFLDAFHTPSVAQGMCRIFLSQRYKKRKLQWNLRFNQGKYDIKSMCDRFRFQ